MCVSVCVYMPVCAHTCAYAGMCGSLCVKKCVSECAYECVLGVQCECAREGVYPGRSEWKRYFSADFIICPLL